MENEENKEVESEVTGTDMPEETTSETPTEAEQVEATPEVGI